MKRLISDKGNLKLDNIVFLKFNLPARITCPYRTPICESTCYAYIIEKRFTNVRIGRRYNMIASIAINFKELLKRDLDYYINKYTGKQIFVRLHESGDFYSQEYFNNWLEVIKEYPNITFITYTKSLKFILAAMPLPENFIIFYSVMPDTREEDIKAARDAGIKIKEGVN